jgi:hypothetical protein
MEKEGERERRNLWERKEEFWRERCFAWKRNEGKVEGTLKVGFGKESAEAEDNKVTVEASENQLEDFQSDTEREGSMRYVHAWVGAGRIFSLSFFLVWIFWRNFAGLKEKEFQQVAKLFPWNYETATSVLQLVARFFFFFFLTSSQKKIKIIRTNKLHFIRYDQLNWALS